jgi:hypothetical protein
MDKNYQIIADHIRDKDESVKFKERRFNQWNESYSLYRDKVNTNRLTQRQPVNIPIIRETIQTWISKIDEAPKLKFETRDKSNKDKDAEIVMNELYDYYYDKLKLDILDNAEKKIVGLQGRGFKKIGISKGEIFIDLIDPYDIEIDPRVNPIDIETANYVIHTHIYRSLREILANPNYTPEGKKELKQFLDTKRGILKAAEDEQSYQMRKERLENLGVTNFDEYGASDVIVELNESYKLVWNEEVKQFVRHIRTIATDSVVLSDKPLKEAIGIRKLPIVSWASDPDAVDFWSDGIADNVRQINKVVNMYFSQDLENRTYRNFGMYFFNTMNGTFQPRAFDPKPFGMYGLPGNPSEIMKQVEINPLGDVTNNINYLKDMIQSSVAQTAIERGEKQPGEQTLGQVQLSLQNSQGRNSVVSKNYRRAWKELGCLFYDLLKNNNVISVTLFKKGQDDNYEAKQVFSSDYITPQGYEVKVEVEAEANMADDFDLKKIQYIKNSFANNPKALMIAKQKELELMNWTEEEIASVMALENPQAPLNTPQEAPSKQQNPQDSIKNTNALPGNI